MAWGNTNTSARSGGGSGNSLLFKNIIVDSASFTAYTPALGTEEEKLYNLGYICRASVALNGCLEVMTPDGTMSMPDIINSGVSIFSQTQCYDGGIYLYATGIPNNSITILSLELSWSENITIDKIATPDDIGAAGKSATFANLLLASNWVDGCYELLVPEVTASSNQELLPAVDITEEQLSALQAANIQDAGQSYGTISLKAFGEVPTIDIPIRVILRRDA